MKECEYYDNWCEKEKRTCKNCYYEGGYNMNDEEKEILNNLKEYMQNSIDKGYNKFIYNDLDWDFKCIDCINVIDKVLKQSKEVEELKEKNKTIKQMNKNLLEVLKDSISKDKIKAKIEEFKQVRDEILRNEKEFNRPMMTYDLKRNDYCEKMLQSLLEEE